MGTGFRVTCFIDNLCTFDDVGVYKGGGLKEHLVWGWEISKVCSGDLGWGYLNRTSLKMW